MESRNFEPVFADLEKRAKIAGAEVELLVDRADRLSISFQKGEINKFDSSSNTCAGVRVIARGSAGYAFTENLADANLVEAFDQALSNADFAGTAAGGMELYRSSVAVPELPDLYNAGFETVSIEEKIERARLLEAAALSVDSRITAVPYGGYSEADGEMQILTSTGVRRKQRWTSASATTYALAKQGDESRMGGETEFYRDARKIDSRAIAELGAKEALAKLGSLPPETGRYPVVFDAETAMSLFGLMAEYFSAKAVDERRSIFASDLGKAIGSRKLNLIDDPHYRGGIASRAFDSEGAAAQATPLIKDGVLQSFLTNTLYARKMNLPHTASASRGPRSELDISPSNLVVTAGQRSLASLLDSSPRVIYVTGVTGLHAGFRPGSGDFSLQSEGELWENGKRVRPLCNFVVSGNVRDLLEGLDDVSDRVLRPRSSVITPDLLIRELSIAGA